MKCNYSLTFEFELAQPVTVKGIAEGGSARAIISRAVGDAVKRNKNMRWSSIVVVIERENVDEKETEKETED